MSLSAKLKRELKALAVATLFFGAWIGGLILLKTLVLEEYDIGFSGWSKALAGALILGKVALIFEHASLGAWGRGRPGWVDVLLRTALYSAGVAAVMVIEHGVKGRHEHGGFVGALNAIAHESEFPHILASTICLSGALLVYNILSVIRRHLGSGGLLRLLMKPLPEEPVTHTPP